MPYGFWTEFEIIGWDFPLLSQEQMNVFHMHGYEAALIVNNEIVMNLEEQPGIFHQEEQTYIAISIREPMTAPFQLIPNAYKVLMTHMKLNHYRLKPVGSVCC